MYTLCGVFFNNNNNNKNKNRRILTGSGRDFEKKRARKRAQEPPFSNPRSAPAGASGLLCLLHMQVAVVCCGRHRLSCVGFAGNSVRIYMLTEYR